MATALCQTCSELAASLAGNAALSPTEKGQPQREGQTSWRRLTSDGTEATGLFSVPSTDS